MNFSPGPCSAPAQQQSSKLATRWRPACRCGVGSSRTFSTARTSTARCQQRREFVISGDTQSKLTSPRRRCGWWPQNHWCVQNATDGTQDKGRRSRVAGHFTQDRHTGLGTRDKQAWQEDKKNEDQRIEAKKEQETATKGTTQGNSTQNKKKKHSKTTGEEKGVNMKKNRDTQTMTKTVTESKYHGKMVHSFERRKALLQVTGAGSLKLCSQSVPLTT